MDKPWAVSAAAVAEVAASVKAEAKTKGEGGSEGGTVALRHDVGGELVER